MDARRRAELRTALLEAAPWLTATDYGPRSVVAGPCDRCRDAPRLLPTCGPTAYEALCRDCAAAEGDDAWCAGHLDDGHAARTWAATLPERWADAVALWWVATGEVRLDAWSPDGPGPIGAELGPAVRAALTGPDD